MIDIRKKLTSRKFWLAVIGFITPLMVAFGCTEQTVTQASAIIMAGGTLIAYIIGEGLVDSSHVEAGDATAVEPLHILHASELNGTADAEDE